MAFDTPARIAVLGAGPIGLEAALYARYLGYDVDLYERGYVAESVRRWGHIKLFTPFATSSSSLGRAAIEVQSMNGPLPAADEILTGQQWIDRYLLPLSQTDLLLPHLQEQHEVVAVGHEEFDRTRLAGSETRADYDFQLLVRDSAGNEAWSSADIVIDATGVFGNPNYLGPGGLPAAGELRQRARIEYSPPDVLGRDRPLYAGKRVLLCGADYSAAWTMLLIARLVETEPATSVVWITRPSGPPEDTLESDTSSDADPAPSTVASPPIRCLADDPFPFRDAIASEANQIAASSPPWLTSIEGALVRAVAWQPELGRFRVKVSGAVEFEDEVDRIVASVGFRPDLRLSSGLPIAIDSTWEAPLQMAAELSSDSFDGRRGTAALRSEAILTSEPNYYCLGAKSFGRHPGFLYRAGLEQIRALFSIIGERADLNLYRDR